MQISPSPGLPQLSSHCLINTARTANSVLPDWKWLNPSGNTSWGKGVLAQVGTMFVTSGCAGIQDVPCFFTSPCSLSLGFLFAPPQLSDFLTWSCRSSAPIFNTETSITNWCFTRSMPSIGKRSRGRYIFPWWWSDFISTSNLTIPQLWYFSTQLAPHLNNWALQAHIRSWVRYNHVGNPHILPCLGLCVLRWL